MHRSATRDDHRHSTIPRWDESACAARQRRMPEVVRGGTTTTRIRVLTTTLQCLLRGGTVHWSTEVQFGAGRPEISRAPGGENGYIRNRNRAGEVRPAVWGMMYADDAWRFFAITAMTRGNDVYHCLCVLHFRRRSRYHRHCF